ncbi:hypothetical protein D3C77_597620 [compost metagenome]
MTLRLLILTAPLARFAVTIMGSISGVSPTATAIANNNASVQFPFIRPLIKKINGTITNIKRISRKLTLFIPLSKLVSGRSPVMDLLILPK